MTTCQCLSIVTYWQEGQLEMSIYTPNTKAFVHEEKPHIEQPDIQKHSAINIVFQMKVKLGFRNDTLNS